MEKTISNSKVNDAALNVVDVVIIGGGVSGLVAAREIERQGMSTAIMEAAPQLGGRCLRQQTIQNCWLDLGGQWMGKTHNLFQALSKELGIEIFKSYFDGNTVLVWNGKRVVVPMSSDWAGTFLDVSYNCVPALPKDREAALKLHREFLSLVETVNAEREFGRTGWGCQRTGKRRLHSKTKGVDLEREGTCSCEKNSCQSEQQRYC